MTTRTRRRVAALGATLVVALALAGPMAAIAQAAGTAPAGGTATTTVVDTFHPGRGAGPLTPNAAAPSSGSVIGAIALTIAAIGVVGFVLLSLDRRSAVRLQSVEGSGLTSGESPSTQAEDQKRKAA